MDIIKKIIEIRKNKGLTQSLMAEKLGIAPNNYGKIEKGHTELTVSRLNQIAEILGVSISSLITDEIQTTNIDGKIKELEDAVSYWKELAESRAEVLRVTEREFRILKERALERLSDITFFWIKENFEKYGLKEDLASFPISQLPPFVLRQIYREVINRDYILNYTIEQGWLGEDGESFREHQRELYSEQRKGLIEAQKFLASQSNNTDE